MTSITIKVRDQKPGEVAQTRVLNVAPATMDMLVRLLLRDAMLHGVKDCDTIMVTADIQASVSVYSANPDMQWHEPEPAAQEGHTP